MADDKLKLRAREVARDFVLALMRDAEAPCTGDLEADAQAFPKSGLYESEIEERIEKTLAAFAAELVAETRAELASERRYSSEELRMALADMRLETLEEAAKACEQGNTGAMFETSIRASFARTIRTLAASTSGKETPTTGLWRCPYCNIDLLAMDGVGDSYGNPCHKACLDKVREANKVVQAKEVRDGH